MAQSKIQYGQYEVPSSDIMVNFGVGQPSNSILPLDIIKDGMKLCISKDNDSSVLQYGDIPGYYEFRKILAQFLNKNYNTSFEIHFNKIPTIIPDSLFITNGVSQSLQMICNLYHKEFEYIIVEEPTYFLAINIFKEMGIKVKSVPMDNDGIIISELKKILNVLHKNIYYFDNDMLKNKNINKIFLYTIPTFQNPTSITMSHKRRKELITLMNDYPELYILADEVYQLLYFEDKKISDIPPPPLRYYGMNKNIISIGTFSKILAPSLRLGWIDTNEHILQKIKSCGLLDSSGGLNPFVSSIIHKVIITGGQDKYLKIKRNFLKERCNAMISHLKPLKKYDITYTIPTGGYFVWITLPTYMNSNDLLKICIKNKVKFHVGNKFSGNKKDLQNSLRISFSFYTIQDIIIGVKRLCDSVNTYYTLLKEDSRIKVAIHGASGRLGSLIVNNLLHSKEFLYTGPICRNTNLSTYVKIGLDVIIDVSSAQGTLDLIHKIEKSCIKRLPLIIGTTGNLPIKELEKYSENNPIAILSNFSYGIPLILDMINGIDKKLQSPEWNYDIIETHHKHKKDIPSGTAKSIKKCISKDIEIDSIRRGNIIGIHELVVSNDYETIEIIHSANDRNIFAIGSLRYIPWIITKHPGIYYNINENIEFYHYTGCGNSFIIIDMSNKSPGFVYMKRSILLHICKKINTDGLIIIEDSDSHDFTWTYLNKDGSEVEMCGNGARCVTHYMCSKNKCDKIKFTNRFHIETLGYLINKDIAKVSLPFPTHLTTNLTSDLHKYIDNISVNTDHSSIDKQLYSNIKQIHTITVGVPHLIIILNNDYIPNSNLSNIWRQLRGLTDINLNIVYISENKVYIRTFERGVEKETLACGTGCCATAYVIYNDTIDYPNDIFSIDLYVKSGNKINIELDTNKHISWITGNVENLYKGYYKN